MAPPTARRTTASLRLLVAAGLATSAFRSGRGAEAPTFCQWGVLGQSHCGQAVSCFAGEGSPAARTRDWAAPLRSARTPGSRSAAVPRGDAGRQLLLRPGRRTAGSKVTRPWGAVFYIPKHDNSCREPSPSRSGRVRRDAVRVEQAPQKVRWYKRLWLLLPIAMAEVTGGTLAAVLCLGEAGMLLSQFVSKKLVYPSSILNRNTEKGQPVDEQQVDDDLDTGGALSMDEFDEKGQWRTLLRAVVGLGLYLTAGLMYARLKGWGFTDAAYFIVVTLTTVGYGELNFAGSPVNQIFGGLYVFVGVGFIGVALGEALAVLQGRAEAAAARLKASRMAAQSRLEEGSDLEGALRGGMDVVRSEMQGQLRSLKRKLVKNLAQVIVTVLIGSVAMVLIEGWSFANAFLWASVTATTVGYGDVVPALPAGKWFSIVYILLSFSLVASALGYLASIPGEARRIRNQEKVLTQFGDSLEAGELTALIESEELRTLRGGARADSVSRSEFILWLLIKTQKVDLKNDVMPCAHIFSDLDPDGSGALDQADIELFQKMKSGQTA